MLYRDIVLLAPSGVRYLAACLVLRRLKRNLDPGRWVRRLVIDMDGDEYTQDDVLDFSLGTLLSRLPNLEIFQCEGIPCGQDELVSLGCGSNSGLRSLEFTVGGRVASLGLVLTILGHMHTLRELKVTFDSSEVPDGGCHPLSAVPGLELPKLIKLQWTCSDGPSDQLSAVLGRSRFPALTTFFFCALTTVEDMPGLCAFLDAHGGITELHLPRLPNRLEIRLLDKARHIIRFETPYGIPHVDVIEHLPPTCRTLAFGYFQSTTEIRAITERLEALPAVPGSLREIHLTSGFLWNKSLLHRNISDYEAMRHGQILHLAARLHKIGICIRDRDGVTIVFSA
jgi:hypothetical protein